MKSLWIVPFTGQNGRGYLGNGAPLPLIKLRVVVTKSYLVFSDFLSMLVCQVLSETRHAW